MFDPQKLITETGEYDLTFIKRTAYLRACRDYSSDNPPSALIRSHFNNLTSQAYFVRFRFRREHGLPDDTVYSTSFQLIDPERLWA